MIALRDPLNVRKWFSFALPKFEPGLKIFFLYMTK